MSVKVHEPVCEDSAQDLYFWFDHFLGDQIKDEWTVWTAGGGSGNVIDAQTGGIMRLAAPTNATGDAVAPSWGSIRSLHIDKKVTMEVRAKINSITQITTEIELRFDGTNQVYFRYVAGGAGVNWSINSINGGALTNGDSGIAADTDYHIFRIECFPTDELHFYIDGVECANSPITTNIPDDAGDYLQPAFYLLTTEVAEKQLDIDYCVVRQER